MVAAVELLRQLAIHLRQTAQGGSDVRRWLAPLAVVVVAVLVALLWQADVESRTVGLAMIGLVVVMIVLGMPIAMALLLCGLLGLALIKHDFGIATRTLALAAGGTVSDYVFATVPLFVLMGLFVNVSEIGREAFVAAQRIFGRVYGGLGVATVAANAVFAAITGISIAAAAIFTKIAVPEMVRHGYTPKFAVGLDGRLVVARHADSAEPASHYLWRIGRGVDRPAVPGRVLPGILLATAFAVGVILMAWLWPSFGRQRSAWHRRRATGRARGARGAFAGGRADRARARRHLRRFVHADGGGRRRRLRRHDHRARQTATRLAEALGSHQRDRPGIGCRSCS